MSRLIESIKLLDGKFYNLDYHEERMERSLYALFKVSRSPDIQQLINGQDVPATGLYKCRIIYDSTSWQVAFEPYQPRTIRRVKIVEDNGISYLFKFSDRRQLNRLFELRGDSDDVMIIKDEKVTDCSFSNVVFKDADGWHTPDSPLLKGTMREKLIREGKVKVREIRRDDIRSFDSFRMINAMLEFDAPDIDVSQIVF